MAYAFNPFAGTLDDIGSGGGLTSPVGVADGGTGQTTESAAFQALGLSVLTTTGDLLRRTSVNTLARLAIGASTRLLGVSGSNPSWVAQTYIDHGSISGLGDDDHTNYLYLGGRSGGQLLGTGHAPDSFADTDVAFEGRVGIGSGAWIGGNPFLLNVSGTFTADNATDGAGIFVNFADSGGGAASGNRSGLNVTLSAGAGWSTGTSMNEVTGLTFVNNVATSIAVPFNQFLGIRITSQPNLYTGSYALYNYGAYLTQGIGTSGVTMYYMAGYVADLSVGPGASLLQSAFLAKDTQSPSGTVTDVIAFDVENTFGGHSGVTNWYGLRIPAISGPGTIWGVYVSGTMDNAIAGKLSLGSTTAPTQALSFPAGGNILTDTSTGTKIGTATSQLFSLWNATPIAQPTTAIAAATLVTNTSLIANDSATFDGYTLGQVVKALRNFGILA